VLLVGSLLLLELLPSRADGPRLAGLPVEPARSSLSTSPNGASATSSSTTTAVVLAATTATVAPAGLPPARVFSWLPVDAARYYVVTFTRDEEHFYRAWPTASRLTLPLRLAFRPGAYRWVVRPGLGRREDGRLGAAVVDTAFVVSG